MRAILTRLGVSSTPVISHHNLFHVYLRLSSPHSIANVLLASSLASDAPTLMDGQHILDAAQNLFNQVQSNSTEETQMFVMDVPNLSVQESVVSAVSVTTLPNTQKFDRVIGVCHLSENPYDVRSAVNVIDPSMALQNYFYNNGHLKITSNAKIFVLQTPTHGKLEDVGDGNYAYYPDKAYKGGDRATLMVEMGGKKVKMEYFFRVIQTIPQEYEDGPSPYELSGCPKKVPVWKIATVTDFKR